MIGLFAISMLRMMLRGSIEVRITVMGSRSDDSSRIDDCTLSFTQITRRSHSILCSRNLFYSFYKMLMSTSK
jgi:hypothetical protein